MDIIIYEYSEDTTEIIENVSLNDLKNLFYYHLTNTAFYEFKSIKAERHTNEYKDFYHIEIKDMFYKYKLYFKTFSVFYEFLNILISDKRVQKKYSNIVNINYESFSYNQLDKYF